MTTPAILWRPALAMMVIVAASNHLVQFPINAWWTWGALTYPFSFLVTDATNRRYGPSVARMVVYCGFALGVVLSFVLAPARIAIASGAAFLVAQLFDIGIFNRLRRSAWWIAPFVSSAIASVVDTAVFFAGAFAGTDVPWVTLAAGDLVAKLVMALVALGPYRLFVNWVKPVWSEPIRI
jgi:queuosine precursor transporter